MSQASNQWGVELNGTDEDKKIWRMLLKPPFDPFVEEIEDQRGNYLVLRSAVFDGIAASIEVHQIAKQLFRILNVTMAKNADADPVINGAVVEFVPQGPPQKHYFLKAEPGEYRSRGRNAEFTVRDAQGNVIEPPPAPSRAQLWMCAANLNPDIGSALRYMEGKPDWVELYKAFEAVRDLPNGGISSSEVTRFTRTANVGERHHPTPRNKPHRRPMELWEARALITQWVSAAIDDILAKNP